MDQSLLRLSTYVNYPTKNTLYPSVLAARGFTYTGQADEIQCVECKLKLRQLLSETDVINRHKVSSLWCSFATSANASSSSNIDKINSSEGIGAAHSNLNFSNSEEGSFHFPSRRFDNDVTRHNDVRYDYETLEDDSGDTTDSRQSFIVTDGRSAARNSTATLQSLPVNLATLTLDSNAMMQESLRLQTFNNWPKQNQISRESLADSGFFYTGNGDLLQCAFCAVRLGGWTLTDNAANRHMKNSPDCPFINGKDKSSAGNIPCSQSNTQQSGIPTGSQQSNLQPAHMPPTQHIVQQQSRTTPTTNFQSNNSSDNDIQLDGPAPRRPRPTIYATDTREVKARMDLPWSHKAREMGFSEDVVRIVICERLLNTGQDYPTLSQFIEALFSKTQQVEQSSKQQQQA